MLSGNNLQDQMLQSYIDKIFDKYDADRSGSLDEQEMTFFFNDLFQSLNMNITINKEQALEAIKSIDQNYDGNIDKK
jgi:Ca2+-binding EF-hand superfamily protein